ncbi:transmembrane protein, putative [Bodo saltans]|uniref:Transmembrane protein, putative n=1 Tax=Bodo saltans TaxID=75058 RepID=A0A0S4J643_BODSA|nr:transmembrane protein, putative [Bodo saltans]|eukprot:CUG85655.1 transmembrane protein, putative [Bodo saltans]
MQRPRIGRDHYYVVLLFLAALGLLLTAPPLSNQHGRESPAVATLNNDTEGALIGNLGHPFYEQQGQQQPGHHGGSMSIDHREVIAQFEYKLTCDTRRKLHQSDCVMYATQLSEANASQNAANKGSLSAFPRKSEACALKFWGTTEAACADPTTTAFRKRPLPRRLCSCPGKRVVAAQSVTLLAKLFPGTAGHVAMTTFIAVTKTPNTVVEQGAPTSPATSEDHPYYLIDSSAWLFVMRICWEGEARVLRLEEPRLAYVLSRLNEHRDEKHRLLPPRNVKPQLGGLLPPQETQLRDARRPWSCAALRKHPLAVHHAGESTPPVYYALEYSVGIAGHALEVMMNGIGMYLTSGLHEQRVPWLVPCSDEWEGHGPGDRRPLLWTAFFVEMNEALRFPIYPVDFHKHFDVDSPRFTPLVFGTMHFASPSWGHNILCFKKLVESLLWPHAVTLAAKHNWSGAAEDRFEALRSMLPATNERVVLSAPLLENASKLLPTHPLMSPDRAWTPHRRIALLKVLKPSTAANSSTSSSAFHSPGRSYLHSARFERLLLERGILSVSPTLPLFERMWHVNSAELIVTTWGSTYTSTLHLLFERQQQVPSDATGVDNFSDDAQRHNQNTSRPLRILVMVHPSYCNEVTSVFRVSEKLLCGGARRVPAPGRPLLSRRVKYQTARMHGDPADYYGGSDFCVQYVFTHSLASVGSRKVDFRCD